MKFSYDTLIDAAPGSIDLGEWLFGMTDEEYVACSPGHRAMGINGGSARVGVVNVESVGGVMMIQHYRPEVVRPDHVKLVSDSSQAYLLHVFPARIRVLWEMQTFATANGTTGFRGSVEVTMPLWVRLLAALNCGSYFLKRHVIGETAGFAANIAAKIKEARSAETRRPTAAA